MASSSIVRPGVVAEVEAASRRSSLARPGPPARSCRADLERSPVVALAHRGASTWLLARPASILARHRGARGNRIRQARGTSCPPTRVSSERTSARPSSARSSASRLDRQHRQVGARTDAQVALVGGADRLRRTERVGRQRLGHGQRLRGRQSPRASVGRRRWTAAKMPSQGLTDSTGASEPAASSVARGRQRSPGVRVVLAAVPARLDEVSIGRGVDRLDAGGDAKAGEARRVGRPAAAAHARCGRAGRRPPRARRARPRRARRAPARSPMAWIAMPIAGRPRRREVRIELVGGDAHDAGVAARRRSAARAGRPCRSRARRRRTPWPSRSASCAARPARRPVRRPRDRGGGDRVGRDAERQAQPAVDQVGRGRSATSTSRRAAHRSRCRSHRCSRPPRRLR